MTQVGEGQDAMAEAAPAVMTFGVPTVGELLAERYQLEQHVNNDSAGRQVWRGVDVVLRRPVAVVLRHPGGEPATEMLQAAVAASRVIHPHLVGVYDAIDEGQRAYVVREWVDGEALREVVAAHGPLDPERATAIARCIGDAVAAVHATGMVHGNVHPGTTLIGDDGRVVLADARADNADTPATDVRAIGGLLYFALTGHWPHAEAGVSSLPDAVRDGSGAIAAPRQVRAGVPAYLDDLTMDLLDPRLAVPTAEVLAAELGRLDAAAEEQQYLEDVGPLRFARSSNSSEPPRGATRKIAAGVACLLLIAVIGLVIGIRAITDSSTKASRATEPATVTAPDTNTPNQPSENGETPAAQPKPIALKANQVRIVDPKGGDRGEVGGTEKVIDSNRNTAWETDAYEAPKFGNLKSGMGVLIDLGAPRSVQSVKVELSASGATAELRTGDQDFGNHTQGDEEITKKFAKVGEVYQDADPNILFRNFDAEARYRFLLVWISQLPSNGNGKFQIGVEEIVVEGS